MNADARNVIAALELAPLPHEGGWFRQTWRSETGSVIYFLLTPEDFSALHRLRGRELWYFYAGDPIEHVMLDDASRAAHFTLLGADLEAGHRSQVEVPGGTWQGARVATGSGQHEDPAASSTSPGVGPSVSPGAGWSLVGCTMTPAWNEADFELGARDALLRDFPEHAALVRALTR